MHLKNFPKRLDSKTSSLRITVPENLDLALEGLIRKVLREQPKTDYIHSFAAEYFETLLKIRDKAGAKYTSEQLCPFHNDEDAHEMIKLANTFDKPSKKSRKESPQAKEKMVEGGVSSRRTGRPKAKQGKQTTPDLIKKLPGNREEEKEKKKKEGEKENHEEELLTGDPIKELVEKELEMEALAKRNKAEGDNGRSEATKEKERTDDAEESTDREEAREVVKIPAAEETVAKDEHPTDETETKRTEERPIEAKVSNGQIVEDKPLTTEKDSEMIDSAAEEETAVMKDDGNKLPSDEMEGKTPSPTVEDKLPTAKEDRNSEKTAEVNTGMRNGDGGTENPLEETKEKEKEPENSPRQLMTGNDGTETQPEEKSHSEKEDKAEEVQDIEAEEARVAVEETPAPIEDTNEHKINAENDDQQQKQQETVEQKEEELGVERKQQEAGYEQEPEATVEQKEQKPGMEQKQQEQEVEQKQQEQEVEQKQHEQEVEEKQQEQEVEQKQQEQEVEQKQQEEEVEQNEQPEPEIQQKRPEQGMEEKKPKTGRDSESERKNSESEEKTLTEEMTQEQTEAATETDPHTSEKTETVKPEKKEKSETKEEMIANKENVAAPKAEPEEVTPTAEEMPNKEDESDMLETREDDKLNDLDRRTEQQEKDDGSKADSSAAEEPLKEAEDVTAVKAEEVGKDEGDKSEDVEKVEDAPPSTNGTAAVEKPQDPEPQADTKPEIKEIQNEKQEDELSTTTDIQQEATEDEHKDDTKQQEEELCTVVDSHHIIRIEEPEAAPDDTGVAPPPEEVQIKTIQTHYYDALKVPEILTKEFRVHNVGAALPEDAAKVEENNSGPVEGAAKVEENNGGHAEGAAKVEENNSGHAEDSAKVEENNSGPAEGAAKVEEKNSGPAEDPQINSEREETADSAEKRPDEVPLLVTTPGQQELGADTVRSDDLLDLMTPTSGYSLNLSELSWQTVSGLFLDSERLHSSHLSDELRYKTVTSKPDERDEIEEVFHRTVVPTLVGAVPMPPRDAEEIDREESDSSLEASKDNKKKLEDVSNSKSFDSDTPFISVEVKTVIETQVLDDEDEEEGRPRVELTVQATVDVEDVEETTRRQQNLPEAEEKDISEGQEKGGSGESDSTMSSAATEIKRSDSGRRGVGAPGSLMQSQSLDLGGRNPLLRTRSLSTFRHGVTDFEVWSAIEKELEDAATKIQTKFRSYKARKKLQREDAVQITTEESSPSTTPAEPDERQQSTGEFHDSIVLSDHPR